MRVTGTIELIDGKRYKRAIEAAYERAASWAVDYLAKAYTDLIKDGRAFDGSRQKQNAPATRLQKQRRRGHSIPLVDSGRLSTPSAWRKTKKRKEHGLAPPADRERILSYLEDMGYKVDGLPPGFMKDYKNRLEAELLEAERIIQASLIKRRIG